MGLIDRIGSAFAPRYYVGVGNDAPVNVKNYTARELYRTQGNLQAVVGFLADSIAHLPLKVYARSNGNERTRDRESNAAKLLWLPNSEQTQFEFIKTLASEYLVFGAVYVWILRNPSSAAGYEARIIPTDWVRKVNWENRYAMESIVVSPEGGDGVEIPRAEFVCFHEYSPGNPAGYVSKISALNQTLTEQLEAGRFRRQLWSSSGRMNAYLYRPANVAAWDEEQRKKFAASFRAGWSSGGSNAGKFPLLEDGMEIRTVQPNFKESQWAESVKISREEVAAAYHVNPGLIWHTDTQTYASAKDHARALYAECLGPIIQMIQQRINAFLLPMIGADPTVTFVEFDLREKLKGSFEERASILQSAVGGPWMTRDEARADNNLPPLPDGIGSQIITPLNVLTGGQASPTDTHMDPKDPMVVSGGDKSGAAAAKSTTIRVKGKSDIDDDLEIGKILERFFARQSKSVIPKIGANAPAWWDAERWDKELADDLEPAFYSIGDKHGKIAAEAIGTPYVRDITLAYLRKMAEGRARAINAATERKLIASIDPYATEETPEPAEVMQTRADVEGPMLSRTLATAVAGWAVLEAGKQAQQNGTQRIILKEWVTGPNPRSSHAAMNGERVPLKEPFSNGAMWPGDDVLGPAETCYCNCSTDIIVLD